MLHIPTFSCWNFQGPPKLPRAPRAAAVAAAQRLGGLGGFHHRPGRGWNMGIFGGKPWQSYGKCPWFMENLQDLWNVSQFSRFFRDIFPIFPSDFPLDLLWDAIFLRDVRWIFVSPNLAFFSNFWVSFWDLKYELLIHLGDSMWENTLADLGMTVTLKCRFFSKQIPWNEHDEHS